MGARTVPAPEGYEVVKCGARWIILITPRVGGKLVNFGFIVDPTRADGKRIPAEFPRRAQAITYAQFHQLEQENAALREQLGEQLGERATAGALATAGV